MMQPIPYGQIRAELRPGDVVAFAGADLVSRLIRKAMDYPVSHVGMIAPPLDSVDGPILVEATMRRTPERPQRGVHQTALDELVPSCVGSVWWLPLRRGVALNRAALDDYLRTVVGVPFDVRGALRAVLSELFERLAGIDLTSVDGGPDALFCAELVTTALMRAGILPPNDPSDASPRDVCRWSIYEPTYWHIAGAPMSKIPAFNSLAAGSVSSLWSDAAAFRNAIALAGELQESGASQHARYLEEARRRL